LQPELAALNDETNRKMEALDEVENLEKESQERN
jgi:hypothetical protein